jgi:hypothetical protein
MKLSMAEPVPIRCQEFDFNFASCMFSTSFLNQQHSKMAAMPAPEPVLNSQVNGDLTDEQMDALLDRATARLKAKSQSQDLVNLDEKEDAYTFPKLDTGKVEKPYISTTTQNVATADAARLVDDKQRKKADGIRRVEEPVQNKKLAREVRIQPLYTMNHCYEENSTQKPLEQSPAAVLV